MMNKRIKLRFGIELIVIRAATRKLFKIIDAIFLVFFFFYIYPKHRATQHFTVLHHYQISYRRHLFSTIYIKKKYIIIEGAKCFII